MGSIVLSIEVFPAVGAVYEDGKLYLTLSFNMYASLLSIPLIVMSWNFGTEVYVSLHMYIHVQVSLAYEDRKFF
jgi:hypothetical protein